MSHKLIDTNTNSAELFNILDQSPTPIFIHNDIVYLFVNKEGLLLLKAESFKGIGIVSPKEIIQEDCLEILSKSLKSDTPSNDSVNYNSTVLVGNKDSEYLFNSKVIEIQNQKVILTQAVNLTEIYRIEEQKRQSQKMEAVGQLAGGIAHDINNMLTSILGYSELGMMEGLDTKSKTEYFKFIREKGEEAAQLIRELMSFSQKQKLATENIDLEIIVDEIIDFINNTIRKNINFTTKKNSKFGKHSSNVDMTAVKQIVSNIISNAEYVLPNGGNVTLQVDISNIAKNQSDGFTNVTPGEFLQLSITDSGKGVPKDILHKIFDPFFTTKDVGEGTGLGLSMVYGLMEKHCGFVTVDSTEKRGTTFNLYFPIDT